MSDEETEIEEPVAVQEQLKPENVKPTKLNKNGKPRKQMSQESLDRLAKAREKANALRKKQTIEKLEKKVEKLNNETQDILPPKPKKEEVKEEVKEEEEEVKEVKEKPKAKAKSKKKTKIIVEQSSEDSDEFEQNDHVVFVKRVSRKKKVPIVPIVPEEQPQVMEQPPMRPQPPIRPQLTQQQAILKNQYDSMFTGGFLKKYY